MLEGRFFVSERLCFIFGGGIDFSITQVSQVICFKFIMSPVHYALFLRMGIYHRPYNPNI